MHFGYFVKERTASPCETAGFYDLAAKKELYMNCFMQALPDEWSTTASYVDVSIQWTVRRLSEWFQVQLWDPQTSQPLYNMPLPKDVWPSLSSPRCLHPPDSKNNVATSLFWTHGHSTYGCGCLLGITSKQCCKKHLKVTSVKVKISC